MDRKEIEKALEPGAGITTISTEMTIRGDVESRDNFLLEGVLEGSLNAEALVYVGPRGKVKGDIKALKVVQELNSFIIRNMSEATNNTCKRMHFLAANLMNHIITELHQVQSTKNLFLVLGSHCKSRFITKIIRQS